MKKIKVLNLYAGIGGNRKHWPNDKIEVVAVETNEVAAQIYQDNNPNDKVIIGDAEEYLVNNHEKFDFIWSSPVCIKRSRLNTLLHAKGIRRLPDFHVEQQVYFLRQFFKGSWVVENVSGYINPNEYQLHLVKPTVFIGRHYFWSNYPIPKIKLDRQFNYNNTGYLMRRPTHDQARELEKYHGFDLSNYKLTWKRKERLLRNCVYPGVGLHVFNCAFKTTQTRLI